MKSLTFTAGLASTVFNIVILGLMFTFQAQGSTVRYDKKSLSEIIQKSDFIFIAEKQGRTENGFDSTDNFKIAEIIFAKMPVEKRIPIKVTDANIGFNKSLAQHIKKQGYNGAPSVILPSYTGLAKPSDKMVILFLNRLSTEPLLYKYTMSGSVESKSKSADIKSLIKTVQGSL